MNKFILLILSAAVLLSCNNRNGPVSPRDNRYDPGGSDYRYKFSATIYEPGGENPATDATIRIFAAGLIVNTPVAVCSTDYRGRYEINTLPVGIYNLLAEKDSFVLFQDSLLVTSTYTTLRDDTLECPSSLSGIVAVEPYHAPRTVTIQLPGTGRRPVVIDTSGHFLLTGLASGTWPLLIGDTLSGYLPALITEEVAACTSAVIADTIRLAYTGIPIVSGIRISHDTLNGNITLSWEKTAYANYLDYVVYRDTCGGDSLSEEPLSATGDTFFTDSTYLSLVTGTPDTIYHCLRYRVAVRSNQQEIGPTYRTTEVPFALRPYTTIIFSHQVRHAAFRCDSASINDTVAISLTVRSSRLKLRRLVWYDPVKRDTISAITATNRQNNELTDSIRYAFDSVGTTYLLSIVTDNAGTEWGDTIPVNIVKDYPIVNACNDTGVFIDDTVRLHGRATDRFGYITGWKWKIGSGTWSVASDSDTVIIAPSEAGIVICSLAVTDDDGNRSTDEVRINVSSNIRQIVASQFHSLILKTDGTLWACGNNNLGELGDGTTENRLSPVQVMTDVQSMDAGYQYSLMLKTDGTLWACGDNFHGQLGDGTKEKRLIPVLVMSDVQSMAASHSHSLILKTDGTVWACGSENKGQIGDGTTEERLTPVRVLSDVQSVDAGFWYSLFLKIDGTLWMCGLDVSIQCSRTREDPLSPAQVMTDVKSMAAGAFHNLILKNDGTLLVCGINLRGGLVADDTGGVKVIDNVQSMSAGSGHSLIIKTDGTLWACGFNGDGQPGDGTTIYQSLPVRVMTNVQSVSAGDYHSLMLKTDGTLWACGANYNGQLGDGTTEDRTVPVRIIPQQ